MKMIRPDLVLVKPGSQKRLYGGLNDFELTAIEPPLWGALPAARLAEQGYGVELLDAEIEDWSHEETARRIVDLRPMLAVITVSGTNPSASTMNMTGAGRILEKLAEYDPEIKTALFGLHPSALPKRTMAEEKVDFVIQGEGFITLPELLEALKSKSGLAEVRGLWRREEAAVLSGPPAPLQADLSALPRPAWERLPIEKYRAHNWHCFDHIQERQPYAVIYSSLGCPFSCGFCCINALFGRRGIRYRSPEAVVEEIDFLVERFGVRNIKIIDEMFAMNREHVARFCELVSQRDYGLNMWAYARVNTVTSRMLAQMKRAGINWLAYGFESGSERVLAESNKNYDPKALLDVVRATYDQGIYICGNFIFGLPGDDLESMNQTLDLALEIKPEWANLYSAMAYPGSRLYEDALARGTPLSERWEDYSQYSYHSRPLPTGRLSGSEVLRFRDEAFQRFYTDAGYLAKIEQTYGPEIVEHIGKMASRPLPREYDETPRRALEASA